MQNSGRTSEFPSGSRGSYQFMRYGMRPTDATSTMFASNSFENVDVDAELRRLQLEMKKTRKVYNAACKELLLAQQKVFNLSLYKRIGGKVLVGVAIDKDNKSSQYALEWAVNNVVSTGQCIILIHVMDKCKSSSSSSYGSSWNGDFDDNGALSAHNEKPDIQSRQLFLTFKAYCTRKNIQCLDVVLEGTDVAKTLNEYISSTAIGTLILGASSHHGLMRTLQMHVIKGAPDFCTIYVISNSGVSSMRNACRPPPFESTLIGGIQEKKYQLRTGGSRHCPYLKSLDTTGSTWSQHESTLRGTTRTHDKHIRPRHNRPVGRHSHDIRTGTTRGTTHAHDNQDKSASQRGYHRSTGTTHHNLSTTGLARTQHGHGQGHSSSINQLRFGWHLSSFVISCRLQPSSTQ